MRIDGNIRTNRYGTVLHREYMGMNRQDIVLLRLVVPMRGYRIGISRHNTDRYGPCIVFHALRMGADGSGNVFNPGEAVPDRGDFGLYSHAVVCNQNHMGNLGRRLRLIGRYRVMGLCYVT